MPVKILSILVFVSAMGGASEQAPSVRDIFVNVVNDQKTILKSPLHASRREYWSWAITGISILTLMPNYGGARSFDERIISGIERENQRYENSFRTLTYLGDGSVLFGASLTTYAVSAWRDDTRTQRFSAHWTEALIDTTLWVTAIKILAGRNRPEKVHPESEFAGPLGYFRNQGQNSSFPSGHAALAFTTAAVFTRESGYNPWVGIPAYLVAGSVGFSRMYVEKHWLSDVLIGAILGHSIGMLVENKRAPQAQLAWNLMPQVSSEHTGVTLVYQW